MDASFLWDMFDIRTVLLGFFVFSAVFWFLKRPWNLPPGPSGWPIVGYLPHLAKAQTEPHEVFSKLSARYGDVISVNLAGNLIVILHGYQTVKGAFSQQKLSGRPTFNISDRFLPGVGIVSSSGAIAKDLRRFSLKVMRSFGIGKSSFEQNITDEGEYLVNEIKKQKENEAFDPKCLLGSAVSNIISSVVFGKRFKYTDPKFQKLIGTVSQLMAESGAGSAFEFSPVLAKLTFLPVIKKYINTLKRMLNIFSPYLDEAQSGYDVDAIPQNYIESFLKDADTKDNPGVRKQNLVQAVIDLFLAGSETTTTTLRWGLLYLMAYPEVQNRLQKELDGVTSRNRFPKITDKPDLPYTHAFICEVERIDTIAPLSVPHTCTEDTMVAGYNIPKGTVLLSNLWHNHFDPSVWKEPTKFRPERFLNEEGKFVCPEELTPFGIGQRVCLGEALAKMEIFVFLTLLVHHFSFRKPSDAPPISFKAINGATWAPVDFMTCAVLRD